MQGTSTARAPGSPQFSGDSLIRMDEPLQKLDPHLYQVRHNSHLCFSQFEGEPPQCPLGNLTEGALVLAITQLAQNRSQPHQAAWWCSYRPGRGLIPMVAWREIPPNVRPGDSASVVATVFHGVALAPTTARTAVRLVGSNSLRRPR